MSMLAFRACWKDLVGTDATRAYTAVRRLARASNGVALLNLTLGRPWTRLGSSGREVARFLRELDSDDFETREQASRRLESRAPFLRAQLEAALSRDLSPEVRRRIKDILAQSTPMQLSAEQLREVRALEALEMAESDEARTVLTRLVKGPGTTVLTRQAQLTLTRIERRTTAKSAP